MEIDEKIEKIKGVLSYIRCICTVFEKDNKEVKKSKDYSATIASDIISTTKKLKESMSTSNENENNLVAFLNSEPIYLQYLKKLINKLIYSYSDPFKLDDMYLPFLDDDEGKLARTRFEALKKEIRNISEIEVEKNEENLIKNEISKLIESIINSEKYNLLNIKFDGSQFSIADEIVNNNINLVKQFYIELCTKLQSIISPFIGKKYTRNMFKQLKKGRIKKFKKKITINCFDSDLSLILTSMLNLKNRLDKKYSVDNMIDWYNLIKYSTNETGRGDSPSVILRESLKNAGIAKPPFKDAAHHIVAYESKKAEVARKILLEYGIDLNSAANGVFLPMKKNSYVSTEAMHSGGHSDKYFENVSSRIQNTKKKAKLLSLSKEETIRLICDELQEIRKDLLSGKLIICDKEKK